MSEQNKMLLGRHTYRRVKNMNHAELTDYITKVYLSGYEAGRKAATPDQLFKTIREVLLSIDGIGPTRADAIMKKLGDTYAMKEKGNAAEGAGNPAEADGNAEEVQQNGDEPERGEN